ncbi:MAG: glycosyltransferase 2 family protein, partial [Actinomycetota bacterium]|nr:glycosyltransferase 2 family protein [Actinomycetota bacterium]
MRRPHLTPRQRLLTRLAFFAVIVVLFGVALNNRWEQVRASTEKLSILDLVIATACGLGNIFVTMMAWRSLLADIGSKLPIPVAMRIFFLGQLGKYLPGSVWTVVAQADLGRDYKVPPRRSVAVSVVTMGISLAAALMIAAFTLPFSSPDAVQHNLWVLLLLPLLVVALMPSSVDRLTHLLLKVLRREPPDHEFTWQGVLRALAWLVSGWVLIGLEIYVLMVALHAPSGRALPLALGGAALAFSLGFVAILVPAGVGVREVVLVAVLS